ncbi:nucleotidyl transferase AbiEii/AbiGii toxin family protein [Polyangium aurulentum]|uniref:nucleotidyl transferase AbiEii/AbiGii toxin family protein n=1 Tax=Polyangium aurulentum TaxID=2567896 RepID=UPI0010AECF36|nr:nucleotidyl transferase AbiEii/AbiGii toxin family protein [Polyangium aurulentum]UQA61866.1 nucleotidyl transferase AbiEii/AbiGii toxin family protein [Polyangium aurulentum]
MDPLLEALAMVWQQSGAGDELRLIGGLAVRLHAGTLARATADIDIVVLTEPALKQTIRRLEEAGWTVGTSGGWWRAVRPGADRLLVDIASHPVVNPRTFDTVSLRGQPAQYTLGDVTVSVAGRDDLAALKLAAARDQDLVDLLVLARCGLSHDAVARTASEDDIERTISAGAHRARHALRTGTLREAYELSLAREPEEEDIVSLDRFLQALERSGL